MSTIQTALFYQVRESLMNPPSVWHRNYLIYIQSMARRLANRIGETLGEEDRRGGGGGEADDSAKIATLT